MPEAAPRAVAAPPDRAVRVALGLFTFALTAAGIWCATLARSWPILMIGAQVVFAVMFALAELRTGLSLLLAARSILRYERFQRDASDHLGGMLVNLVWSVRMGYAIRPQRMPAT